MARARQLPTRDRGAPHRYQDAGLVSRDNFEIVTSQVDLASLQDGQLHYTRSEDSSSSSGRVYAP